MKKKSVIVNFSENLPKKSKLLSKVDVLIAPVGLRETAIKHNLNFKDVNELTDIGDIYEASAFFEELSQQKLPNNSYVPKSFMYKGYELWWIHCDNIFLYFCLPYSQYKKLLEYLKDFETVYFFNPPYKALFSCYLRAHKREVVILRDSGLKMPSLLPFGVFVQIILTIINIPILMVQKRRVMLFTGDKFDKGKDYDFRMKFIYKELREKNIKFVEFIRGLESWKTILKHAWKRKRPVIYSETATFVGKFLSILSGGRRHAKQKFGAHIFASEIDPEIKFKYLIATQYLLTVYDDIWAIRIMKWILRLIGVKTAIIPAANERNFHTVLGCKLNNIPTVGILHGVASRFYNIYDFLPGFCGSKILSVDKYGLWSEWWREYYLKYSNAYRSEQLFVSGPMRPLEFKKISGNHNQSQEKNKIIKILFAPGELSNPVEVISYLEYLMKTDKISVYLSFRPYRDGFKRWIDKHKPELIDKIGKKNILSENIHEAIAICDVVVGTYSTGALEAFLQLKPVIFFNTRKWGDYFDMKKYDERYKFFAENPEELIEYIKKSKEISKDVLKELQKRFFGDQYKNGSKWVVEQIKKYYK